MSLQGNILPLWTHICHSERPAELLLHCCRFAEAFQEPLSLISLWSIVKFTSSVACVDCTYKTMSIQTVLLKRYVYYYQQQRQSAVDGGLFRCYVVGICSGKWYLGNPVWFTVVHDLKNVKTSVLAGQTLYKKPFKLPGETLPLMRLCTLLDTP